MLLKSLINNFIRKRIEIKFSRSLLSSDVELIYPFTISNQENLLLGKYIYIGPNSWFILRGKLRIEDGTIIGPRLKVHTSNHNYEGNMIPYSSDYIVKDVHIGKNVWIGADVTILPGINIGDGAVIAACTCVVKDVPPFAVVGGNPSKILKYRNIENYNKCLINENFYLKMKREKRFVEESKQNVK